MLCYTSVNLMSLIRIKLMTIKLNRIESERRMSFYCISIPTCKIMSFNTNKKVYNTDKRNSAFIQGLNIKCTMKTEYRASKIP